MSGFNNRNVITRELRIGGDDWHLLVLRLRDEQAVERIAVMMRQGRHLKRVRQSDLDNSDVVACQTTVDERF